MLRVSFYISLKITVVTEELIRNDFGKMKLNFLKLSLKPYHLKIDQTSRKKMVR